MYTMDHPVFNVYSFMENSIGLKRVNTNSTDPDQAASEVLKKQSDQSIPCLLF